jgi:predicted nuclease with TOPRIM domain
VEMRAAEPIWDPSTEGAEASLIERLEAQVEALNRKVGRLERRQQRFADMVRLLLALHDQTAARLQPLSETEDLDEIDEISRETTPLPRPSRPRRTAVRRSNG